MTNIPLIYCFFFFYWLNWLWFFTFNKGKVSNLIVKVGMVDIMFHCYQEVSTEEDKGEEVTTRDRTTCGTTTEPGAGVTEEAGARATTTRVCTTTTWRTTPRPPSWCTTRTRGFSPSSGTSSSRRLRLPGELPHHLRPRRTPAPTRALDTHRSSRPGYHTTIATLSPRPSNSKSSLSYISHTLCSTS
jgi:hypothetical protein